MKYIVTIILICVLYSCTDPTSVDADRKKIVIDDPSKAPPKYEILPNILDFGEILFGQQANLNCSIKNLTNKELLLSNVRLKSNPNLLKLSDILPIILNSKGDINDNKALAFSLQADKYGYFIDTLLIDDNKNPVTIVKASIPALYADDIEFSDTQVSEFQLSSFNFKNISNQKATITEFTLIDENNVFLNEPNVQLPIIINPKSNSNDIKIIFNPNAAISFKAKILINATFEGTDYPFRRVVNISGSGRN
ncbi:MAG TPA: hypothetical protein PLE30_00150 [Candidatus Kapabacteria bacterium]|nr:hypothetical protein [Candidatus Kapabacteria bacterium]